MKPIGKNTLRSPIVIIYQERSEPVESGDSNLAFSRLSLPASFVRLAQYKGVEEGGLYSVKQAVFPRHR